MGDALTELVALLVQAVLESTTVPVEQAADSSALEASGQKLDVVTMVESQQHGLGHVASAVQAVAKPLGVSAHLWLLDFDYVTGLVSLFACCASGMATCCH